MLAVQVSQEQVDVGRLLGGISEIAPVLIFQQRADLPRHRDRRVGSSSNQTKPVVTRERLDVTGLPQRPAPVGLFEILLPFCVGLFSGKCI